MLAGSTAGAISFYNIDQASETREETHTPSESVNSYLPLATTILYRGLLPLSMLLATKSMLFDATDY